ncbi:MAG: acetylornithine deacetylase [Alphaproteobacteria bacterium]|nr:acetylornithine deacetylase [Alphaproteobacteria bacterium]
MKPNAPAETSPIELLEALVAFDTTSHKSNVALIRFVADYLGRHGIEAKLVPNETGDKINLYATIGPAAAGGGIGLSGHTDVVPVTGQDWDSDPFELTARNGRLYGRGTTDMKGYLACVLAAVPDFAARPLKRPIHILFSYDEEIGCIGVRPMLARLGSDLPMPEIVFVGEPTGMEVVDAHKGPARWNVTITGRAAHSSMAHLGVNAVHVAAQMIGELRRIEDDLRDNHRDERFEPPYATLQVTTIEGGAASNIIPLSCRFGFEVRALPGVDVAAIERRVSDFAHERCLPSMRAVSEAAAIDIELVNYVPPFAARNGSKAVALALHLAGANRISAVSYATEAGLFQTAGPDTVVCGPGQIAQAHTANEWIAESELAACMAFLKRLAEWAEK